MSSGILALALQYTQRALGLPLLLGVRYFTAEPQEKRRMRLMVDGVGRFGR